MDGGRRNGESANLNMSHIAFQKPYNLCVFEGRNDQPPDSAPSCQYKIAEDYVEFISFVKPGGAAM